VRILTRYILREILSHAVLGGALFTFVLFMRDIGRILELVVRGSASMGDVGRIFCYTLPSTLTLTIPMTVLVGILLGLSRLSADSEVTAMRACGFGVMQFVRVVSIATVIALAVGLFNSVYIAPKSMTALLRLQDRIKASQASFEVQPRVFYEDFKDYVLYVQDSLPAQGASVWRHVFMADLTEPATPHITTAEQAVVVAGKQQSLRLHFRDGSQHQISPSDPNQYDISTFTEMDVPMQAGMQEDVKLTRSDAPIAAMSSSQLWKRRYEPAGRQYLIELNRRISYPIACLVLMLVGVPLGLSSRRGGKSTGFVLTILLVFIYYIISYVGVALAKQGKLSPAVGVWTANFLFAFAGILLLRQMTRGTVALGKLSSLGLALQRFGSKFIRSRSRRQDVEHLLDGALQQFRRMMGTRFPSIFDDYVMREFLVSLAVILSSFLALSIIFSFFELIGDIIRNRTALITVGDYLLNLIPYMLYNLTPLCALIAVLVSLSGMNRSSEITAMKASGISLYRIVTPIFVLTALLAVGLFLFDDFYLPQANRRQESLRSVIKGKPAQTFLRPDRKWMSGQQDSAGEPTRIFYYQFLDPDKDLFANLTVFEFEPGTFALQRRIFATSARWDPQVQRWVMENGWQRTFNHERVSSYQPFTVSTFPEIHEQPVYFKKEVRTFQEMTYGELTDYIHDLKQSGFDTMRLRVQLNRKLAYPLMTLVMAIFAVPFAMSMGKRGSLTGIATAIGMAIAYQIIVSVFESMGNVNVLPPMLAAWCADLLFGLVGIYLLLRTPT
jgi:LPS export ABC transporter permease LptF/LPS export ABC transporter permease LptG